MPETGDPLWGRGGPLPPTHALFEDWPRANHLCFCCGEMRPGPSCRQWCITEKHVGPGEASKVPAWASCTTRVTLGRKWGKSPGIIVRLTSRRTKCP